MSKSKLSINGEILKKAASLVIEGHVTAALDDIDGNVSAIIEKAVEEFTKSEEFKKLVAKEITSVLDNFVDCALENYFDQEGYELVSEFVLNMLKEKLGLKIKK